MKLKPAIASYSGAGRRIRQFLDDHVLNLIAAVAQSPQDAANIPPDILSELVEMHVLAIKDHQVRLDTAVFLEADIYSILSTITPLSQEIARRIQACGTAFRNAPPEVTLFLAGIVGFVQGMGRSPKIQAAEVDWKNYTGKQNMPPANGMLHLWRYVRRLTANELCANGFFREPIPAQGIICVAYENDVALIREFLY